MKGPCTNEHAGWFRDVRALLDITERSPGLPLPRIGATEAAFHYTSIVHAKDAAEAVALAETVLSYALRVEFQPRRPEPVGSTRYYILSAYMASGLRVDIVAGAGVFDSVPARETVGAAA